MALLALVAVLAVLLVVAVWPTDRVLLITCQPAEVPYDGQGPYCLSVVETDIAQLNLLDLGVQRHHALFVGRGDGPPVYGHRVDYSPNPGAQDLAAYLDGAEADWRPDGVTFREPSGHTVFLPADQFTGGR